MPTAITFPCQECRQELTIAVDRTKPIRCPHCYAKNERPGSRKARPKQTRDESEGAAHYLKAIGSIGVGLLLVGFALFAYLDSGGRVIAYGPGAVGLGAVLIGVLSAASGKSLSEINDLGR